MPRKKPSPRKSTRGRKKSSSKSRKRTRNRIFRWLFIVIVLLAVVATGGILYLDRQVTARLAAHATDTPAHLYSRPREFAPGQSWSVKALTDELKAHGYRRVDRVNAPATFAASATRVEFAMEGEAAGMVVVDIADGIIVRLTNARGAPLSSVTLPPILVGSLLPFSHKDRTPVSLHDVPEPLLAALIAIEDRGFSDHIGIDPRGIARAMWVNIRSGRFSQGGSTITQQLAKNLFLSPDRTLSRKLKEMVMALVIEWRFDKHEILEAYVNEVYLGQAGNRAIHGFALAAQHYFSRGLTDLTVGEMAALVGMIRAPSYYNPVRNPERARARRDTVLKVMLDQGQLTTAEYQSLRSRPLRVSINGAGERTPHAAFVDYVGRSIGRDFPRQQMGTTGLNIHTTLDLRVQRAVDQALEKGLAAIEANHGIRTGTLQVASVVVDARSGDVLALAGDRNPGFAGFNRALDAVRPVGSLIKPAVYLTALERSGTWHWASLISDTPVTVTGSDNKTWSPRNYDNESHGEVLMIDALANSYNVPTVRLGMALGVEQVVDTLSRLGVGRPMKAFPSLLLGSAAMTPLEVAQMYQVFAARGQLASLRVVAGVTGPDGEVVARYKTRYNQAVSEAPAYLIDHGLRQVVRRGTGKSLMTWFDNEATPAGKTGTTDDYRDSWFAGYLGDLVVVVWVGRDDNGSTGLTGAAGALPLWGEIVKNLPLNRTPPKKPSDVFFEGVDVQSGGFSDHGCPEILEIPFIDGSGPDQAAPCASAAFRVRQSGGRLGDWLRGFFSGNGDQSSPVSGNTGHGK